MVSTRQNNLNIGESSDEEDSIYNAADILSKLKDYPSYAASYFLTEIGQSILEVGIINQDQPTVRQKYREKKKETIASLSSNQDFDQLLSIKIDNKVLDYYLKYKHSEGRNVKATEEIKSWTRGLDETSHKYVNQILNQEKELVSLILLEVKDNLLNFIMGVEYNKNIVKLLQLDYFLTPSDFLKSLLNSYFKPITDWEEVTKKFAAKLHSEDTIQSCDIENYMKPLTKAKIKGLNLKSFINDELNNYVKTIFARINNLHEFYIHAQECLSQDNYKTLNQLQKWYKKYTGTEISKTRTKYTTNSNENDNNLYLNNFLLESLNLENESINVHLLELRPKKVFLEDFTETLVNFLLDHRIIRNKLKEQGIKHQERKITFNKALPSGDHTDEELECSSLGSRKDLRFLEGSDSYRDIAKKLYGLNFDKSSLKENLIKIIQGKEEFKNDDSITLNNKIYLYKLADLLFLCETQRSVSAFLTIPMFFDLLKNGIYLIETLPDNMPMAKDGTVDIVRKIRSTLQNYLQKDHKFDFKDSTANTFEVLEFDLKNMIILTDWLKNSDIILDVDVIKDIIKLIPTIREVSILYKDNTKKRKISQISEVEEEEQKVEHSEPSNKQRKSYQEHFLMLLEQLKNCKLINDVIEQSNEQSNIDNLQHNAPQFKEMINNFKSKFSEGFSQLIKAEYNQVTTQITSNFDKIKFAILQLVKEWYNVNLPYLMTEDSIEQVIQQIAQVNLGAAQEEGQQINTNFSLHGSGEYGEEKPIGYINQHFGEYTLDGLDHILHLRISDLHLKNIEIIQGIFIDQNHNNIPNLLSQILNSSESKFLVPLNLFNKHATGLIFEKSKDDTIQITYLDSLNECIPHDLKQLIVDNLGDKVNFNEITVEQQKYANCGAEVIENFIMHLTGKRVSQEKTIELHSKLVENALLKIDSSGLHLLFEEVNSNYSLTDYLEQIQHDNNQFHSVDYNNLQHVEVTGEVTSFH